MGAGLSGLYALHRLRERGLKTCAFETGGDVGGTWYWNRYPGARCDVESLQYRYTFDPELQFEWAWTEKYATQEEINRYISFIADRLDLRRDVRFETTVTAATFDDNANLWTVRTDKGDVVAAPFLIMGTGNLSTPLMPDIEGLDEFQGEWYHSGRWPHEEVDFRGKRVGVIGTGATGIQIIPIVAEQAEHLTVFQRTPNYSVPAFNRSLGPTEEREFNASFQERVDEARHTFAGISGYPKATKSALDDTPEERRRVLEERWDTGGGTFALLAAYNDLLLNREANESVAEFVRDRIRGIVKNPKTAEILIPVDQPIGSKRLPLDTNYFETFNRDNVSLVDIRSAPIERLTATSLQTTEAEYELDAIILATGFDAMTGALLAIDIQREGGPSLKDVWVDGPKTYLGLMIAGLPNLFMITGPGSPSVKMNVILGIEQHVDWIVACLDHMDANGLDRIEATRKAQDAWVAHSRETAERTLAPEADSWYVGANVPGKPRVYMPYYGGFDAYWKICDEIVADGYRGFTLSRTGNLGDEPDVAATQ